MKKLFFVVVMALMASSVSAQLITSNRTISRRSHNVWLDLGVGGYTGDNAKGTDLNLGIRVNKMFHEYVGWDIIKAGARANTEDFGKTICAEALTGIRGESPELFSSAKAYANFAGGYIYNFDASEGAFEWEIGAGLKFASRYIVGVAYNSYSKNSNTTGIIGLRLGVAF